MSFALVGGCNIFPPLDEVQHPQVTLDWTRTLYPLEGLAYFPIEPGSPLHVKGSMTPPDGLVVVPSKDRRVRGLDAGTGQLLWEFKTGGANVAQPVAVGDDVLVASLDGRVYRLRQRNGRPVWTSGFVGKGSISASPAVDEQRLFATSDDNRIAALSLEDGRKLWERERPIPGEFSITGQAGATILPGNRVVTGFADGRLVAFDAVDGATLWAEDLSGGHKDFADVDSTPALAGDLVLASSYRSGLYALDERTGTKAWFVEGEAYGTASVFEGIAYVPKASGLLLAVDSLDGKILWSVRVGNDSPKTPAVSPKYVLLPVDTALLVLDRGSGRALLRYDDRHGFSATPELAWGTIYAQANSGLLYALGVY